MKRTTISLVFALTLLSSAATAQERAGDAVLGAVSGAVVLGPVGAVAGAFVGYAAGPSIADSWGLRRSHYPRYARRPATAQPAANAGENRSAPRVQTATVAPPVPSPQAAPSPPPAPRTAPAMPPVQPLE